MDPRRFDDLTRLVASTSRRRLLKTLAGATGGALLGLAGRRPAAADGPAVRFCANDSECGTCGACWIVDVDHHTGVCVSLPKKCRPCGLCEPSTLACVPNPGVRGCGQCGRCDGLTCVPADERCPACRSCSDQFLCEPEPDGTSCGVCHECQGGVCRPVADGTPCPGGVCRSGVCVGPCPEPGGHALAVEPC